MTWRRESSATAAALVCAALLVPVGGCVLFADDEDDDGYAGLVPETVPDFSAARFSDPTTIDNPYLPLVPGTTRTYLAETEDGEERIVVEVLDETQDVAGVTCRVVRDPVGAAASLRGFAARFSLSCRPSSRSNTVRRSTSATRCRASSTGSATPIPDADRRTSLAQAGVRPGLYNPPTRPRPPLASTTAAPRRRPANAAREIPALRRR